MNIMIDRSSHSTWEIKSAQQSLSAHLTIVGAARLALRAQRVATYRRVGV